MTSYLDKKHNSNPHEIITISFNMQSILHDKYYNIGNLEKYLVQTWSQANIEWNKTTRNLWYK